MQVANCLIILANVLWTVESFPQIMKLIRTKQTKGISLLYFIMCSLAYLSFIIANIILKNWTIAITCSFPFITILIITFLIIKYQERK